MIDGGFLEDRILRRIPRLNFYNPMSPIDLSNFNGFGDDAKAWTFILSRQLTGDEGERFLSSLNSFLTTWTAHKEPLPGECALVDSQIVIVVAANFASGCSIDGLFKAVEEIGMRCSTSLAPIGAVAIKDTSGALRVYDRAELKQAISRGEITPDARVFNSAASKLGELRQGLFDAIETGPFARLFAPSTPAPDSPR